MFKLLSSRKTLTLKSKIVQYCHLIFYTYEKRLIKMCINETYENYVYICTCLMRFLFRII